MEVSHRPGQESIVQWLKSQGLGGLAISELPDVGFVNWVYLIGDELILRVTKSQGDSQDAYTELVAVPAAFQAGVATPELLVFDDSKSIINTVVSLYQRASGVTLGRQRVDQSELPSLYRQIGVQLALLHAEVKVCEDPNGYLDKPELFDARAQLLEGRAKQKIEAVSFDWISRWLDVLEPSMERIPPNLFLHNDLHSFNTMVFLNPLRLSAILDWGDAGWGDPVVEFGTFPIWAADWTLEGYESKLGAVDDNFFGRLIWNDLGAAIEASINPWAETDEPWQPLTTSRWINLIRHVSGSRDSRWKKWMRETHFDSIRSN